MPYTIVRDDITHVRADAIVNAANEQLRHGGGVCGAIFSAAGARKLQAACDKIGYCPTGSAVATRAFRLPARHIIHAVGPVWQGGDHGERELLASCYRSSLELAASLNCKSIAFPLISAGIYGYPRKEALEVAQSEFRSFLQDHEMSITLVLFDSTTMDYADELRLRVARYIDDVYVDASGYDRRRDWEANVAANAPIEAQEAERTSWDASSAAPSAPMSAPSAYGSGTAKPRPQSLEGAVPKPHVSLPNPLRNLLTHLDAGFSETLLAMIDERGLKDSEVYKRANISRQHFSKMRSNPNYKPTKTTVLALAVALRLSYDDTCMLLERAGFALSHADKRDVIVEFFIKNGNYDVFEINDVLFAFDQPLLG